MAIQLKKIEVFADSTGKHHRTFAEAVRAEQVEILGKLLDSHEDLYWHEISPDEVATILVENKERVIEILNEQPKVEVVPGVPERLPDDIDELDLV